MTGKRGVAQRADFAPGLSCAFRHTGPRRMHRCAGVAAMALVSGDVARPLACPTVLSSHGEGVAARPGQPGSLWPQQVNAEY